MNCQDKQKIVGIVGGMGPYTGLDLAKKVYDQTNISDGLGHLSIATLSFSTRIGDRTAYLLDNTRENPAYAIAKIIQQLEQIGAVVVGIPCNTAHTPAIFDAILNELIKQSCHIPVLNMIQELTRFIVEHHSNIKRVGVLCTQGSYATNLFEPYFARDGIEVIKLSTPMQDRIHNTIYDPINGIKAEPGGSNEIVQQELQQLIAEIIDQGAQGIILGCTEIPLVIKENRVRDVLLFDPALILARALIRFIDPNRVTPY